MPGHVIKHYRYSLFILGFSSLVVQVLAIRQLMAYFEGNELVIGMAMGTWMLFTGLGSRLSGRITSMPGLHLLLALSALSCIMMVPAGRLWLVVPGVMAGLNATLLVITLALLPFCLVSGMTFPLLSEYYASKMKTGALPRAYAMESLGSMAGGILFSLVLVYFLDTWQTLTLVMVLNLVLAYIYLKDTKKKSAATAVLLITGGVILVAFFSHPLFFLEKKIYQGQDVLLQEETPYGRLVVTRLDGQISIYQNGMPLPQTTDVISREEKVHYAMLMRPDAKNVLMISGGTGGAVEEALKYPGAHVDYVEFDPYLLEVARRYQNFKPGNRVKVIAEDPVRYVQRTHQKYDVILQNAPDPSSGILNRLYTASYFEALKERLTPYGVLQVSLSGGANYLSDESLQMHRVVYNSLKASFALVGLVPGGKDFFVAGDSLPNKFFEQLYAESGITNQYVNTNYIRSGQLGQRSRKILDQMDPGAGLNTSTRPIGYYLQIKQWLSQFGIADWIIPMCLGLVVLAFLFTLGPLSLGLFAGGFTAASAEFILLLWLQLSFGYVYQLAGLIFTAFMAGLVLGSWVMPGKIKMTSYSAFLWLQGAMIAFVLLLLSYIFLSETVQLAGWINLVLIFSLTIAVGLITGMQYSTAVNLRKSGAIRNVSLSYSADLAGSALGVLAVSIFGVPLLGMYLSGFGLAGLGALLLAVMIFRRPQ